MADIKSTGSAPVTTAHSAAQTSAQRQATKGNNMLATLAVPICLIIAILFWKFVLGSPANFAPGSLDTPEPKARNDWGTVDKC